MKIKLFTLSICALFTLLSQAQVYEEDDSAGVVDFFDDFYGGEEMVEIATGTKKQFHLLPAVASVITSDEIELMGANTIHQVIETVTGIHVYPSNQNRLNPSYSIRGIHTSENPQVLVLVNGVRTTYEFTGAKLNIFDVGVNLVERIEVIRGPGSAVYGADAFSGVINIITKGNNAPFTNEAGVRVGSFDSKSSWVNLGYQKNDLKLSLNAQWQKTDGDNERFIDSDGLGNSGILDTRHKYTDLHAQLDYKGFYTNLWYLDLEGGTGAGAAQVLSDDDITKGEQFSLQTGYRFAPADTVDVDIKFQYKQYKASTFFQIFPDGFSSGGVTFTDGFIGVPIVKDQVYKSNIVVTSSGLDKHFFRVELGNQYSKETSDELKNFGPGVITEDQSEQDGALTSVKGTSDIFIGNNNRNLSYISIQDEWAFTNDWELTAGVRYDYYSDFGSTINPRLALVWQPKHNLTTKFLYGSAYRAPSFGELHSTNNPIQLGNEKLSPEKTDTVELVFDYRPSINLAIALNIFQYRSTDIIALVGNQLENSLEQEGEGIELEVRWQASSDLHIKLGYALQNSEDRDDNVIADAPQHTLDATITYEFNHRFSLYTNSFWILGRERESTDIRPDIEDYVWTNLSLSYKVNNFNLNLAVRNLFNTDAREPSTDLIENDFPLESRSVWFSTAYTF